MEIVVAVVLPLVFGAVIGFVSGLFGIGGALIATPLLRIGLGTPELIALATPLPAAIPAAISGSIAYMHERLIRFDVAWRTLLAALPMTFVGAYLTRFVSGQVLMLLTGLLLAYSAWVFVRRGFGKKGIVAAEDTTHEAVGPAMFVAGALAGFLSGFLAIGGGIVLVPAFLKIVRLSVKEALATSLLCVAALAIPGVITHAWLGHIDWQLALLLGAGVIPMSFLGARLATSLNSSTIERVYGIVMLTFAVYFIIRNL
jgi:uncharacterized membrane protein YfcA